jgi:hypothetical protein
MRFLELIFHAAVAVGLAGLAQEREDGPRCVCGHRLTRHVVLYDLYQRCQEPKCKCSEFTCSACKEVAGLHCRTCQHEPRHQWNEPSTCRG